MQLLSNRIRTRAAMVAAGVAALVTLCGSVGVRAQTPLTLYACANLAGQPRFVAATEACRVNERRFTWKAVGPSGPTGPIPDMVGVWRFDLSEYSFANVADRSCEGSEGLALPQCQPQYSRGTGGESFQVTSQNGEVFAGVWLEGHDLSRLTGVVLSDGTVTVQAFNPSEQRFFFTGTVTLTNGTYQMEGQGHMFDDFGLKPYGPIPVSCDPVRQPPCPPMPPAWFSSWWSYLAWDVNGVMGSAHYRAVKEP